jgi:hypothetical protein
MIERAGLDDVNGLMTGASSDPADRWPASTLSPR